MPGPSPPSSPYNPRSLLGNGHWVRSPGAEHAQACSESVTCAAFCARDRATYVDHVRDRRSQIQRSRTSISQSRLAIDDQNLPYVRLGHEARQSASGTNLRLLRAARRRVPRRRHRAQDHSQDWPARAPVLRLHHACELGTCSLSPDTDVKQTLNIARPVPPRSLSLVAAVTRSTAVSSEHEQFGQFLPSPAVGMCRYIGIQLGVEARHSVGRSQCECDLSSPLRRRSSGLREEAPDSGTGSSQSGSGGQVKSLTA